MLILHFVTKKNYSEMLHKIECRNGETQLRHIHVRVYGSNAWYRRTRSKIHTQCTWTLCVNIAEIWCMLIFLLLWNGWLTMKPHVQNKEHFRLFHSPTDSHRCNDFNSENASRNLIWSSENETKAKKKMNRWMISWCYFYTRNTNLCLHFVPIASFFLLLTTIESNAWIAISIQFSSKCISFWFIIYNKKEFTTLSESIALLTHI